MRGFMISSVYAQAAQTANSQGNIFTALFPMAMVFFIFYFIVLRPQNKKMQQHKLFLEGLSKGEEVVLQSGLIGKITGIADQVITLEVAPNTKLRVLKSAVATKYQYEIHAKETRKAS